MFKQSLCSLIVLIFLLVPSKQIYASQGLYTLSVGDKGGAKFILAIPDQWEMVQSNDPFDYKIIHENKNIECYIAFSSYKENVSQNHLYYELFNSTEALYGDEFWKKSNYNQLLYNDSSDDQKMLFFLWKTEDKIETVATLVYKREERSLIGILLVKTDGINNYDMEKSINELTVTFGNFITNIECFETAKE